ncbi:unnamed protein product [Linum tenue]|uniref:Uncharacterized protein n=1 Tax=Linum tenue TaxID=586396 RepID=A0AAV0I4H4_9ROSI|nr:unnamed protein product [Linum tenue]
MRVASSLLHIWNFTLSLSLLNSPPLPSPVFPPPPTPSPPQEIVLSHNANSTSLPSTIPSHPSSLYVLSSGKSGNQSGMCFPLSRAPEHGGAGDDPEPSALGIGFAKGISSIVFKKRCASFTTLDLTRQQPRGSDAPANPRADSSSWRALTTSKAFDSVRLLSPE